MSRSINLSEQLSCYLLESNIDEHPALEKCRAETGAQFPDEAWFQISPEQASFMQFLLRLHGARRVLEIGTFTGYSALAFALAISNIGGSDLCVTTIDKSEKYLDVAKGYWEKGGVSDLISPRLGRASDVLASLAIKEDQPAFDFAFIDADKESVLDYYEGVLRLLRPGGLLVVDNILWDGKVAEEVVTDPATVALRAVARHAKADPRVVHNLCAVGDGLLLALKL